MKAIRVHTYGGPEVLSFEEMPTPAPSAGEVIVKIEAVGINYIDIYHRTGLYPGNLPLTPGVEAAGIVAAVGTDVTDISVNDRVAYFGPQGAYAEFAAVPANRVVPVPTGMQLNQAAAVLLQGMTAHFLSHATYPIQQGDPVLIHAAAGGVGLLLVQMAKQRGAHIFATVGSEEKAELARTAGADEIILYNNEDFASIVRDRTDGKGVAAVYDSVGKTTFDRSLSVLRPRGMMVLFGQASGPVPPFDPSILNQRGSLFLTRPSLFHYVAQRDELLERADAVFSMVEQGTLDVRIDRTLPLADAADAHRLLEGRATAGKLLLSPSI